MQIPPPLPATPPQRPPPTTDWLGRNWKWLVPLVCLVVLVLVGGFVVSIFAMLKSSDAYSGAVARANSNPNVIAALGSPIAEGFFCTGNISEGCSSGSANLVIPISGPKGEARIYVTASRSLGVWRFDHLVVRVEKTHEQINILETNQASATVPASGAHSDEKP